MTRFFRAFEGQKLYMHSVLHGVCNNTMEIESARGGWAIFFYAWLP